MHLLESKHISPQKLNELWTAIGWQPRPSHKWIEVLHKSSYVISAWDNNSLIGTGRILEDGVMCMFYDIGVHPNFQKQGIGKAIMDKLIDQVKHRHYASIGLFTWEANPNNIPFYEKLGFKKSSGMELIKYMKPE